jgi:hypothetical protein
MTHEAEFLQLSLSMPARFVQVFMRIYSPKEKKERFLKGDYRKYVLYFITESTNDPM